MWLQACHYPDPNPPPRLDRRGLLKGVAAASLATALDPLAASAGPTPAARDLVRAENEKPGTTDWLLTNARVDPKTRYRCPWVEGYCSHTSLRAGDTLTFMVSPNPPSALVAGIGHEAVNSGCPTPADARKDEGGLLPYQLSIFCPADWAGAVHAALRRAGSGVGSMGNYDQVIFRTAAGSIGYLLLGPAAPQKGVLSQYAFDDQVEVRTWIPVHRRDLIRQGIIPAVRKLGYYEHLAEKGNLRGRFGVRGLSPAPRCRCDGGRG